MDCVLVKGKTVRGKSEDQFRRRQIVDSYMGNGDTVAYVTVTVKVVAGIFGTQLVCQIRQRRPTAEPIDGLGKVSFEPEQDFVGFEALDDHGLEKRAAVGNRRSRLRPTE